MENQVKNHIEIEGVMLSPEAIKELKSLQERNNEGVEFFSRSLSDALCLIVEFQCQYGAADFAKNYPEASNVMESLVVCRKEIQNLKAR